MLQIPDPGKEEELEIYPIQGIFPDSRNEFVLALAFEKLGIQFEFQKLLGDFGVRGSQIIDFIAYVAPSPKACFVQGAYWHDQRSESEDILKHSVAEHYYGRGNVIDFSEEETAEVEIAVKAVREKVL